MNRSQAMTAMTFMALLGGRATAAGGAFKGVMRYAGARSWAKLSSICRPTKRHSAPAGGLGVTPFERIGRMWGCRRWQVKSKSGRTYYKKDTRVLLLERDRKVHFTGPVWMWTSAGRVQCNKRYKPLAELPARVSSRPSF